jgi:3-hydroxybutyryl-CoA dehydrogenase
MEISRIAIVGAGQMGAGIAQVSAQAGLEVVLIDMDQGLVERGIAGIKAQLDKAVGKGKLSAEAATAALSKIRPGKSTEDAAGAQFAVEAVTENESVKRKVFAGLAASMGSEAILASNTSSIPITRIAAMVANPERVIGMHFMNPVPVMQLVEIIRAIQTSDATYAATDALARKLGKTTVLSKDMPGFIVNRILIPMINEACFALQEGLGTAIDIDTAMKLGTNQPMGPLALADFIGLDTCLYIAEVLHKGLGEDKYRPAPILRQHVEAGWMGKKTKRGFFQY